MNPWTFLFPHFLQSLTAMELGMCISGKPNLKCGLILAAVAVTLYVGSSLIVLRGRSKP